MNETRDAFLATAIGECFHDWETIDPYSIEDIHWVCKKCKKENWKLDGSRKSLNSNFSSWEGFGKLWNWSKEQDIWYNISEILGQCDGHCLINPDEFANTVYEMLKDK